MQLGENLIATPCYCVNLQGVSRYPAIKLAFDFHSKNHSQKPSSSTKNQDPDRLPVR